MPLINFEVEIKLKWTKYCDLAAAGADKINLNPNSILFIKKKEKLYALAVTLLT